MARTKKTTTRKLEESSWLAQIIKDKMNIESEKMGAWASSYWNNLNTLLVMVREADNKENDNIYYDNGGIVICNIPNLEIEYGTDFDTYGMQCKLRGMAERYKNDNGNYIVSVLTTNDLNSCTIKSIDDLMFQMSQIK
jgi:hypothetical protein